jgi:LEA14-like dessication related protein
MMPHPRLALLLTAILWAGCASQPAVDVALIGLAPVESTLFEQRLRLDFRLQNFSERVIRATGFQITLNVNDRRLARGVDNGAFVLNGLSETRASAVVSTSLFEVARQLLELPNRETYTYELTGRLYLDGWPRSVPFARSGEINRADLQRLVGADGRQPQPLTL